MTIPLIDKYDTFEIVDMQIAAILALETANQQVFADSAGKDPALWEFDVFSEAMNPWEMFQNDKNPTPIVNVWYDTSSFNPADGDPVSKQRDSATYNIDICASEPASDDGTGHKPADLETVLTVHRITRLVRNIIMHPDNTYLQLYEMVGSKKRNIVGKRWITGKEKFQPQEGERTIESVVACRLSLNVTFNETPVTESFDTIELISVEAKRAIDGKVILEADFDTT